MLLGTLSREETMNLALVLGKVLLKSGAETNRVEETVIRFCRANGYADVNVFATPLLIILGDETTDGMTLICRIRYRSVNLSLISEINAFSFDLAKWDKNYEETKRWLEDKLKETPPFDRWQVILASAVGSAAFAGMLGGNSHDLAAAFFVGGLSMALLKILAGYRPSAFWENALAGTAIGALALLCCAFSIQCTMENIIVGALMPFLPGMAFTNGLRDYMAGDLISGNARISEALLFAISIAIGLTAVLLAWNRWGWDLWGMEVWK